jgi:very-short-patch-repair endonuclease
LIDGCGTRPDFLYTGLAAIYVDGPVHLYADRQRRDRTQTDCVEDFGLSVIRFAAEEDWPTIIAQHPHVFGPRA